MLQKEKYLQTTFNFVIDRKIEMRRLANEIEDELKDYYMQPQINSIPDDIEPGIPRIIFTSKNSHSTVLFSQFNISLDILYDENFILEEKKKYLYERIELLKNIIKKFGMKINFMGLTTVATIPTSKEFSIECIKKKYLKNQDTLNVDEVSYKEAKIIDEKYYANILVESYKLWDYNYTPISEPRSLSSLDCKEYGIKLTVDFNDRYLFNEKKGYISSVSEVDAIINKNFNILEEQVEFLKRGE
ncbi:MAG: hypothetical protein ACRDDY_01700 [Clostridium sp.]|uniref:hypothetical protein n=1 Tax=Clostridium sp. TaxID=1506 RepID=UPI003EE497B2